MAFTLEQFLSINPEVKEQENNNKMKTVVKKTKEVAVKTGTFIGDVLPAHRGMVKAVAEESILRDRELIYEIMKNRQKINEICALLGLEPVQESTPEEIEAVQKVMAERAAALEKQRKEAKKKEKEAKKKELLAMLTGEQESSTEEKKEESVVHERLSAFLSGSVVVTHAPQEEVVEEAEEVVEEAPAPQQEAAEEKPKKKKRYFSSPSQTRYNYNE